MSILLRPLRLPDDNNRRLVLYTGNPPIFRGLRLIEATAFGWGASTPNKREMIDLSLVENPQVAEPTAGLGDEPINKKAAPTSEAANQPASADRRAVKKQD